MIGTHRLRASLRAAVLAALAVALVLIPAVAEAQPATARYATYNIGDGPEREKVTDLERLADRSVGVIGVQEASDRWKSEQGNCRALCRFVQQRPAWRIHRPERPGGPAVPILWNNRVWDKVRVDSRLAVQSRYLGTQGVPTRSKPKVISIVVLRHRASGRQVTVANTHLIPSARSTDGAEQQRRIRHVRDHVAAIRRVVGDHERHPVVVTGDFNGPGPSAWGLMRPLKKAGLVGWSTEVTHPKTEGALDHVLRRDLRLIGAKQLLRVSSDHHAVVHELRFIG